MKDFRYSIIVTVVCLAAAGYWGVVSPMGLFSALAIVTILGILEVSLSFDNAVVNASVLKDMDEKWRQLFLTVGILIAVFGMRFLFPIVIVKVATGLGVVEVMRMALQDPTGYARYLTDAHASIAAFGGMFLLLVFLNFVLDPDKERHWLNPLEVKLASLGKLDSVSVFVALLALYAVQSLLPISDSERLTILVSGIAGIMLYQGVSSLDVLFEDKAMGKAATDTAKRSGLAGFLYLEVLDASFSFDGVIGAFAITKDVVIIMLGLMVGAMFVRSLTVYLVHRGTLDAYVYLEHGAHYGIGALAVIMLVSISYHVPELVTGLIGVTFIGLSLWSSVAYNRAQRSGLT